MNPTEVIAVSFVLGLANSSRCLGFCMPVLIPFVGSEDHSLKAGFFTSILFSFGRLGMYLAIGTLVIAMGSSQIDFLPKVMVAPLGLITILYGLWISLNWPKISWCPFGKRRARPLLSIFLGLCMGSLLCPLLWLAIGYIYAASSELSWIALSITSFWIGSSLLIIVAGAISAALIGKLKQRWQLRTILGTALVFIGILYLLRLFW